MGDFEAVREEDGEGRRGVTEDGVEAVEVVHGWIEVVAEVEAEEPPGATGVGGRGGFDRGRGNFRGNRDSNRGNVSFSPGSRGRGGFTPGRVSFLFQKLPRHSNRM